jgi:aminoglycoside phosphotransferase family enzyme/predicted kinase
MRAAVLDPVVQASNEGARLRALVEALQSPDCYPHPVDRVELLETHISWVLLAGDYAYKLKKPVDLGFVDFRSPEARRFYCREEIRLNRRTAPTLYLDVVPIAGRAHAPRVGGKGPVLEHAVRMRRFDQEALLDHIARQGWLSAAHIDALARSIARFHARLAGLPGKPGLGSSGRILAEALRNFAQMEALGLPRVLAEPLAPLRTWTAVEGQALAGWFDARERSGFVRECHGDLHLGNIALIDGAPVAFDGIEFNPGLRWIDMANDIAFTAMDLHAHALPALAHRLLNAWLETTGDYGALPGLRFYLVYRAMVRAKIAAIRASEPGIAPVDRERSLENCASFLRLATQLTRRAQPALLLMHGLSGSGKTTLAQTLLEALGAVRLRSDVERKRLHGLSPLDRAQAEPGQGLYGPEPNRRTYERLAELAASVLDAGFPVIVDAAFLRAAERATFAALASTRRAPFAIVACVAPEAVLGERLAQRARTGADASDAGLAVLHAQIATHEPLAKRELLQAVIVDTRLEGAAREALSALEERRGIGGG